MEGSPTRLGVATDAIRSCAMPRPGRSSCRCAPVGAAAPRRPDGAPGPGGGGGRAEATLGVGRDGSEGAPGEACRPVSLVALDLYRARSRGREWHPGARERGPAATRRRRRCGRRRRPGRAPRRSGLRHPRLVRISVRRPWALTSWSCSRADARSCWSSWPAGSSPPSWACRSRRGPASSPWCSPASPWELRRRPVADRTRSDRLLGLLLAAGGLASLAVLPLTGGATVIAPRSFPLRRASCC